MPPKAANNVSRAQSGKAVNTGQKINASFPSRAGPSKPTKDNLLNERVKRLGIQMIQMINKGGKKKYNYVKSIKRSGLSEGLEKKTGAPKLEPLVERAEELLNIQNGENNYNDKKKIQVLNNHIQNFREKYRINKNLNGKLNSLTKDFGFNKGSLETYSGNYDNFKRKFILKLNILYDQDPKILSIVEKSIYNSIKNNDNVNNFISKFIHLYTTMIKPILIKKGYYGSIPTYNSLISYRKDLYKTKTTKKQIRVKREHKPIAFKSRKVNLTRFGGIQSQNFFCVPGKISPQGTAVNANVYRNNKQIPKNAKGVMKFRITDFFPSRQTQEKQIRQVANTLPRNRLNNGGYNSANNVIGGNVSRQTNQTIRNSTKTEYAKKLCSYYSLKRINNNKNNKFIVNDLSFLIWLDMSHDFYKKNKNPKNILKHSYKKSVESGNSFYTYITNRTNYNGALQFSTHMNTLIKNLVKSKSISKTQDGDYIFNSESFYSKIDILLGIKSLGYSSTLLNKALKDGLKNKKRGDAYFVTVDSKNNKSNFTLSIDNKHLYMPLTSFLDPGSFRTKTGNVISRIKKGIKSDFFINFNPFKITLGTNLTFSYEKNNTTNLVKLGIKNKPKKLDTTIKKIIAAKGNYSNKLSKTFGDLMQILDIASIHPKENVFFYTFDQTAALIYAYIRKHVFGQTNINLILQNKNGYKIFF